MIERLRRALAPDYEIDREVARGGMGVVYAGRQVSLNRPVAVKLLRPDLATAVATQRFRDEALLLAELNHPAIVKVIDAKEKDGLFYYVMEFVDGETLADRLKRGPLDPRELHRLAQDLLSALSVAHAAGVIHRDVKPANIFLRRGRALLGDFGIARRQERSDPGLTTPGQPPGTPRYMPPELQDGVTATMESDVYQAALVIWEACCGERWPAYQSPDQGDWSRVPGSIAPALRRALGIQPETRFPDAAAFLAEIEAGTPGRSRRRLLGGAVAVVLASVAAWLLWPAPPAPSSGLTIAVRKFTVEGEAGSAALADSLTENVVAALSGFPDFRILSGDRVDAVPGAVQLTGAMTLTPDSARLEFRAAGGGAAAVVTAGARSPRRAEWRSLVRQVADSLLAEIWTNALAADRSLPVKALPRTVEGLSSWRAAERLYAEARWDEAETAYRTIEAADTNCLLCTWRLIDIDRWLSLASDPARFAMLNRHLDAFPEHYRDLIRAQQLPWPARFDSLEATVAKHRDFYLASFLLGDELFHRGPLYGRARAEALEPIGRALGLRPDFAPGWEHLAWLLLDEGTAADAAAALDSVPPERAGAGLSRVLRLMLRLGGAWRFGNPADAAQLTTAVLGLKEVQADPRTAAGGRLMMTVDAPAGAVALGRALSAWRSRPEAVRSGLIAQVLGFAALGRLDSLRAAGSRLGRAATDPSLGLYPLEVEAVLTLFDPDRASPAAPDLLAALGRYAAPDLQAQPVRLRAAWMLAMLAARAGDTAAAAHYQAILAAEPAPGLLGIQARAYVALARGDTLQAGRFLARLPPLSDLAHDDPVPLQATVDRLLRAEWLERRGRTGEARLALRWHEHLQLVDFPTALPESGEAAWAVGTMVRWRRARLLDAAGESTSELCGTYAAVARLWAGGEPRFAARADTARQRRAAHRCDGTE